MTHILVIDKKFVLKRKEHERFILKYLIQNLGYIYWIL